MMRRKDLVACLVLGAASWFLPPSSWASRTWNVYVDGSGDAPTIQAAVDSAQSGDVVLVGPGEYENGFAQIRSKSIALRSASGSAATIIRALTVFEPPPGGTQQVEVSGFSLVAPLGADYAPLFAANVLFFSLVDCRIEGYRKNMEIGDVSRVSIVDCDLIHNQDNEPDDPPFTGTLNIITPLGSSGNEIRGCRFIENSSVNGDPGQGHGGGALRIQTAYQSDFRVTECLFLRNSARSGGAVSLEGLNIVFDHNTVVENEAEDGALFRIEGDGRVYGNVFARNKTNWMYCDSSDLCMCNSYWANEGWGPNHGQWVGLCTPGTEDIYADPLFCDPEAEDYRLQDSSPLIPEFFPPGFPDCEDVIGAFGVGCEPQATLSVTWGRLKSLYGR
jgi:hypothetical protein